MRLVAYASANAGKSGVASFLEIYGLFYISQVLGIPTPVAGILLTTSVLWDAITDPIVGWMLDRVGLSTKNITWCFVLGGAVVGACLLMLLAMTLLPSPAGTFCILLLLLTFRTAYTVIDVPHNTLIGFVAASPKARTRVAGLRILFSGLGRLATTVAAAQLISPGAEDMKPDELLNLGGVLTGLLIITLYAAVGSLSAISPVAPIRQRSSIVETLKFCTANAPLRRLFLLSILNSVAFPVLAIVLVYADTVEITHQGNPIPSFVTVLVMAQLLSLALWDALARHLLGRWTTLRVAYAMLALAAFALTYSNAAGLLLLVITMIAGGAQSGVSMMNWALLPDALEANKSGDVPIFGVFGLLTLANKIASSLAPTIVGLLLMWVELGGEPSNADSSITEFLRLTGALLTGISVACLWVSRRSNFSATPPRTSFR